MLLRFSALGLLQGTIECEAAGWWDFEQSRTRRSLKRLHEHHSRGVQRNLGKQLGCSSALGWGVPVEFAVREI